MTEQKYQIGDKIRITYDDTLWSGTIVGVRENGYFLVDMGMIIVMPKDIYCKEPL